MCERKPSGAPRYDPQDARKRLMRLLAFGAMLMAVLVFVRLVDPGTSGCYPACLLNRLTGWQCAGCGATRAVHALTRGRLAEAFEWNPGFLIALPILAAIAFFRGRWFGSPRFWVIFAVAIAGYAAFRNR